MGEWSVLVKMSGPLTTPALTRADLDRIVSGLPEDDSSAIYPGASGRGHGVEARFWLEAADAAEAAAEGCAMVTRAMDHAGLAGWQLARVHVATPEARAIETYPEVESERRPSEWSVMVRIAGDADTVPADDAQLRALLDAIPGRAKWRLGGGRSSELRFWLEAHDAVAAVLVARDVLVSALHVAGLGDWSLVHVHAASRAERLLEGYPGVAARVPSVGS